jgi:hypothetical protein
VGQDPVAPGDVLVIRTGSVAAAMIRLGAALRGHPNLSNHVAVVHHTDAHGTVWTIEGRPGGAGWRDAKTYLASPWTIANRRQPKTPEQRHAVCAAMLAMIGTAYDWEAVAADTLNAFRLGDLWRPSWKDGTVPGQVVCSSLAAWAYAKAGLTCPPGGREVTPGDWTELIMSNRWQ